MNLKQDLAETTSRLERVEWLLTHHPKLAEQHGFISLGIASPAIHLGNDVDRSALAEIGLSEPWKKREVGQHYNYEAKSANGVHLVISRAEPVRKADATEIPADYFTK